MTPTCSQGETIKIKRLSEVTVQDIASFCHRHSPREVVTFWDPFWMPKEIFERHGFTDVRRIHPLLSWPLDSLRHFEKGYEVNDPKVRRMMRGWSQC